MRPWGRVHEGHLSGNAYYEKRTGFMCWEVWYSYQDASEDPQSGANEWRAGSLRHRTRLGASREAAALQQAFDSGARCAIGRQDTIGSEE